MDNFEYYHKKTKKLIKTENKIPFIVDWNGVLLEDINEYLLFKTENQWSSNSKTSKNNSQTILSFLDYCYENDIIYNNISGSEIRKYVALLSKKGNKNTSINQKLSILESLYCWLQEHSFIDLNPFEEFGKIETKNIIKTFSKKNQIKNIKSSSIKRFLSSNQEIEDIPKIEDLKKVYKNLNNNDKLMTHILIETGLRKDELLQLTLNIINNMKPSKSRKSYSLFLDSNKMQIKYNKSRSIVISENLRKKILKHTISKEYLQRKEKYQIKNNHTIDIPLFLSNRGSKFSADKLNKTFKNITKKLNINHFSPHQLRHFYASNFIYQQECKKNNMEQAYLYLSERLGHSSPDTTKSFYVKLLNKEKMREIAEESLEEFAMDFLN